MIGQYGAFDEVKYARDFRSGFYGIEACLFQDEADTRRLIEASNDHGFRIGIHFPLYADRSRQRDALFLAQDETVRSDAIDWIRRELEALVPVSPDYVLFHYPKPVILDDRAGWSLWRFGDPSEYVYESDYSCDEFQRRSEALFEWLSDKSEEYRFTPVLEFDALNRYVYDGDFLTRLLDRHPRIRLCLDTGRLHLQDRIDPSFDAKQVIRKFARYADLIHLKNVKVTDKAELSNHPVLPWLRPEEGWAPIEEYLALVKEGNPDARIMFEHRSGLVSDDELEACYDWVEQLLNK